MGLSAGSFLNEKRFWTRPTSTGPIEWIDWRTHIAASTTTTTTTATMTTTDTPPASGWGADVFRLHHRRSWQSPAPRWGLRPGPAPHDRHADVDGDVRARVGRNPELRRQL